MAREKSGALSDAFAVVSAAAAHGLATGAATDYAATNNQAMLALSAAGSVFSTVCLNRKRPEGDQATLDIGGKELADCLRKVVYVQLQDRPGFSKDAFDHGWKVGRLPVAFPEEAKFLLGPRIADLVAVVGEWAEREGATEEGELPRFDLGIDWGPLLADVAPELADRDSVAAEFRDDLPWWFLSGLRNEPAASQALLQHVHSRALARITEVRGDLDALTEEQRRGLESLEGLITSQQATLAAVETNTKKLIELATGCRPALELLAGGLPDRKRPLNGVPQWCDVREGFVIDRTALHTLKSHVEAHRGGVKVILVTGASGTGKSTFLKRAAAVMANHGALPWSGTGPVRPVQVFWCNQPSRLVLPDPVDGLTVLFVDRCSQVPDLQGQTKSARACNGANLVLILGEQDVAWRGQSLRPDETIEIGKMDAEEQRRLDHLLSAALGSEWTSQPQWHRDELLSNPAELLVALHFALTRKSIGEHVSGELHNLWKAHGKNWNGDKWIRDALIAIAYFGYSDQRLPDADLRRFLGDVEPEEFEDWVRGIARRDEGWSNRHRLFSEAILDAWEPALRKRVLERMFGERVLDSAWLVALARPGVAFAEIIEAARAAATNPGDLWNVVQRAAGSGEDGLRVIEELSSTIEANDWFVNIADAAAAHGAGGMPTLRWLMSRRSDLATWESAINGAAWAASGGFPVLDWIVGSSPYAEIREQAAIQASVIGGEGGARVLKRVLESTDNPESLIEATLDALRLCGPRGRECLELIISVTTNSRALCDAAQVAGFMGGPGIPALKMIATKSPAADWMQSAVEGSSWGIHGETVRTWLRQHCINVGIDPKEIGLVD